MVFLYHDNPIFIQGLLCFEEKLHSIFIGEMREDPLDPYTVVFFLRGEVLESFGIKMANIVPFEDLLCLLNVFLTLINDVHLL